MIFILWLTRSVPVYQLALVGNIREEEGEEREKEGGKDMFFFARVASPWFNKHVDSRWVHQYNYIL